MPSPALMSLALVAAALLTAAPARAQAQAPHDAAALMYSTQLSFGGDGVPMVTIGVMDGQQIVRVKTGRGLRVTLSGPARTVVELPAGRTLTARVEQGTPGKVRYRVVLERLRGGDLEAVKEARQRWGDRGVTLEEVSLGGIVGLPGRVLDNRRALIVEKGFHDTQARAEARAAELARQWELPEAPSVYADPVTRARGRVLVTEEGSGLRLAQDDLVTLSGLGGEPVEVERVEYGRGYAHHGFQDRRFHGEIVLAVDPTARLAVVNRVSAETLLAGIVPSEIFPTAPAAALEAQAITARGELLAKLGVRHLADPFLVCATQHCQVYSGTAKEKATTTEAVQRTRGKMLFDGRGHLVDSVYSASCGGHTEHNEVVWEGVAHPTLRGVADGGEGELPWARGAAPTEEQLRAWLVAPSSAHCATTSLGNKVFRWQRELPDVELDRMVNAQHPIGHVTRFEVLERGVSGRLQRVRFVGAKGEAVVRGELAVRRLLGNLQSGMFVVDRLEGLWRITGGGWGHGVGLCQYGAIGRAEKGQSAEAILEHYYQGTRVESVY